MFAYMFCPTGIHGTNFQLTAAVDAVLAEWFVPCIPP